MLSLGSLTTFLLVQGSNTLFESQERLVDFRSFSLTILVVTLAVLSSLGSCKIDQKELTAFAYSLLLNLYLSDSMTSTRGIICFCSMSSSHLVSLVNQLKNLVIIVNELLLKTSDLNRIVFILSH